MNPVVLGSFRGELEKLSMDPELATDIKHILRTTGVITAGGAAGYSAGFLGHLAADKMGLLKKLRSMPAAKRQQTAAAAAGILGLGITGTTMAMRAMKERIRRNEFRKLRQAGNAG